ncbi:MAG: succinate dehydrogenase, cytochrome b556 subunit [Steroidobacteraceae bacterium]|nr:succinate dehydrogenase, cytochrome b556 subunit [Steroidobacteraceae bacterium]
MRSRPLSPHLGVFKFIHTMVLSILHRISGIAQSVGLLLLTYWLMALATGPEAYARAAEVLGSVIGRIVLAGLLLAFVYHLCAGIRHLTWDAGYGLEKAEARKSGILVVIATVVIFAALALLAFFTPGRGGV